LNRTVGNDAGQNEQPEPGVCSKGGTGVMKERETKEDGRYIIFYTFEDEEKGEDPGEGSTA
jgi:hypothetical protein